MLIWVKVVPVKVDQKFDCYNPHLYSHSPAMSFSIFVERRCELKANVPVNERAGILSGFLLGGWRSQTVSGKSAIFYTIHVNEFFNNHLLRVFFYQRCFFHMEKKLQKTNSITTCYVYHFVEMVFHRHDVFISGEEKRRSSKRKIISELKKNAVFQSERL